MSFDIDAIAQPPSIKDDEVLLEEPVPFQDHFYYDLPRSGRPAGHDPGYHIDICRFDNQGNHLTRSRYCPHEKPSDEEGKVVPRGWTVQS